MMKYNTVTVSLLYFCCLVSLLSWATGCSEKMSQGTVSGTVTYRGAPLDVGNILFASTDQRNSASAPLDANGTFKLPIPLPEGTYSIGFPMPPVNILPDEMGKIKGEVITSPLPQNLLSAESSGLSFTVVTGSNVANFDL